MPDETTATRELGAPETKFEIHSSGAIEATLKNVGPREAIDIANMLRAHNDPIQNRERERYAGEYPAPRFYATAPDGLGVEAVGPAPDVAVPAPDPDVVQAHAEAQRQQIIRNIETQVAAMQVGRA